MTVSRPQQGTSSPGTAGDSLDDAPVLALRFDVDSIRCVEEGIPRLRRLADERNVRFTFFVNMGHSFNWTYTARHVLQSVSPRADPVPTRKPEVEGPISLPTTTKLGWARVLRTIAFNPMLGERYRSTFDALHADGHELGLHGGTDHVVWQRALDELTVEELEELFRPAYETFSERYGEPRGFASPGFRFNGAVLDLLDREGFTYASDMKGETPFRPRRTTTSDAEDSSSDAVAEPYDHYQVPVNVMGAGNVPVIEQGLARGEREHAIVDRAVEGIEARTFALLYGHPYVEGIRADLLGRVLDAVQDRHSVVTVAEYLEHWRALGDATSDDGV